jgi:hypothetical protein
MPSPFPGMDSYLEGEGWKEFHETLAGVIRAQLVPQLPDRYVAWLRVQRHSPIRRGLDWLGYACPLWGGPTYQVYRPTYTGSLSNAERAARPRSDTNSIIRVTRCPPWSSRVGASRSPTSVADPRVALHPRRA